MPFRSYTLLGSKPLRDMVRSSSTPGTISLSASEAPPPRLPALSPPLSNFLGFFSFQDPAPVPFRMGGGFLGSHLHFSPPFLGESPNPPLVICRDGPEHFLSQ